MVKEWNEIPPETCQTSIESMPRGIHAVLNTKGGQTKYHKIIEGRKTAAMFDYSVWFIKKWVLIRITYHS